MADATTTLNQKKDQKKDQKKEKAEKAGKGGGKQKKETAAGNVDTKGLTIKRSDDLGLWYSEMLTKAGIVSYYDVQDTWKDFWTNFTIY